MEWAQEALEAMVHIELAQAVGVALGALIGIFAKSIGNGVYALFQYFSRLKRARAAVAREKGPNGWHEGSGLWLTRPLHAPSNYKTSLDASRILNVINLKGGVGKTTISANLGAALAAAGKRVLVIDFDFQGSLTSMCRPTDWQPPANQDSVSTKLLSGEIDAGLLAQIHPNVPLWETWRNQHGAQTSGSMTLVSSFYDLSPCENRLLVEWLVGDRSNDMRFALTKVLHAPAIRDAFHYIIIDSPPRLTTAAIQALCASTHVLIPTVLDRASAPAVLTMVDQLKILRGGGVAPHLKYAGVLASMTNGGRAEDDARNYVRGGLAEIGEPVELLNRTFDIPEVNAFANALSRGIAYLAFPPAEGQNVRDPFDKLAQELIRRMNP